MPPLTLTLPAAPADRVVGILAILGATIDPPQNPGQSTGLQRTPEGSPYALACLAPGRLAFVIRANVQDTRKLAKAARSMYAIIQAEREEYVASLNSSD